MIELVLHEHTFHECQCHIAHIIHLQEILLHLGSGLTIVAEAQAHASRSCLFHIARHSFAKLAKDKGTDSGVVQGLLAHSSLKTTEGYMGQFDTSVEDAAMAKIFDTGGESKLESFVDSLTPEQREALAKMLNKK